MSDPDSATLTAPYTAAPAIQVVLEKMRQGTVSGPIDRDLLVRMGVKDSLTKRTINSLRTLGLIDASGSPTDQFKTLINTRPDQYQAALADFVRAAYSHVFEVIDPATATGEQLRNAFWGYEPRGQIDAMIRLFVVLCEDAGIIEDRPKVPETRVRPTSTAKKATGKPVVRFPTSPGIVRTGGGGSKAPAAQLQLEGLPPGLLGLLQQIPQDGGSWTTARRETFLNAFSAVLDFTVPVDDSPAIEAPEGGT